MRGTGVQSWWRGRLVLDTIHHLQAHGDCSGSHAARAVAEQLLDRCRSILGPDHPDTLITASTLIRALISLGEAEPARAPGQDTLHRCRRTRGLDHPTTRHLAQVAVIEHASLGDDAAANCTDGPR